MRRAAALAFCRCFGVSVAFFACLGPGVLPGVAGARAVFGGTLALAFEARFGGFASAFVAGGAFALACWFCEFFDDKAAASSDACTTLRPVYFRKSEISPIPIVVRYQLRAAACLRCTTSSPPEACCRDPACRTSSGAGNWRWRRRWSER